MSGANTIGGRVLEVMALSAGVHPAEVEPHQPSTVVDCQSAIVEAHEAATAAMRNSVAHAVRCGELLLQAKTKVPRGEFGAFCERLPFAATTARGYMRLAALDPANRQRVADLPLRAALESIAQPQPKGKWLPEEGRWQSAVQDDGAWHVVPALGYPGLFHVSRLFRDPSCADADDPDASQWSGTWSPIPASMVDGRLQWLGMREPSDAAWKGPRHRGMDKPFGMPDDAEAQALKIADHLLEGSNE